MNKQIEELRDINIELEGLKARKDAVKKKALEHRDTITSARRRERRRFRGSKARTILQRIKSLEASLSIRLLQRSGGKRISFTS